MVVCVIAAVVVGREARRLDAIAPRATWVLAEAVDFVAERLPVEARSRLTPEELRTLLVLHMRWLHARGLQPAGVVDLPQTLGAGDGRELVVRDDDVAAWLLGAAPEAGVALLEDVDAVHVVDAHLAYFAAIGAVGPRASSSER